MTPPTPDSDPRVDVRGLPPDQAVRRLLDFAAEVKASDLLLAGLEDGVAVSVRHLGVHRPVTRLAADLGRHCQAHVKAAAGMDIARHRVPQDGRWQYSPPDDRPIDLRVSFLPTLHGEDLNVRLLNRRAQAVELDELGMLPSVLKQFRAAVEGPSGLVLVTGPTGSGKTTTLYAALEHLARGHRKINTAEDPIEYAVPGIRQSQVDPHAGLGFPELLRAVLRQAPDVIMVGEVRDAVTAETAVRAGNSGHLVLATLHAPGAAAAIHTLETFGVFPHLLGPSLNCVLSQRLVRTLCPDCREPHPENPWPDLFDAVDGLRGPAAPRQVFAPRGCPRCYRTGYRSRAGVFENLVVTRHLRGLIYGRATGGEIYRQAVQDGMTAFRAAAFLKVTDGVTSPEEVARVFPAEFLQA